MADATKKDLEQDAAINSLKDRVQNLERLYTAITVKLEELANRTWWNRW